MFRISRSRWSTISSYISRQGKCFNDVDFVIDKSLFEEIVDEGVPRLLARHFAHVFIHDSLSLFSEKIHQDDENESDHFENIQSTKWQTIRFKPPLANSDIGWRVEFRPMEIQFTDFENAAFSVFMVLLTRVILSYKLNLIIPISKVDENMTSSSKRDAVLNGRFFFRKDLLTEKASEECTHQCCSGDCTSSQQNCYDLMTINEIFHGKGDFPGLLPLINMYLDSVEVDIATRCTVAEYLRLISLRASGELETNAKWIRNFVMHHTHYKGDSVVPERTVYNLLSRIAEILNGKTSDPRHIFSHVNRSSDEIDPDVSKNVDFLNGKSKNTDISTNNKASIMGCGAHGLISPMVNISNVFASNMNED